MRFVFHMRQPFTKTVALCQAITAGAAKLGDEVIAIEGFHEVEDVDGLILFGIGGESKQIWNAYKDAGKALVFLDKGYSRSPYMRVSVGGFQPLPYIERSRNCDNRLMELGVNPKKCKPRGDAILFDGASNKYCLWEGLGDWIEWGRSIVAKIRENTDRPIIYRPRPSHNEPSKIKGAELSIGPLADDMNQAAVVVSYGGNIGWDAVIGGIPHFAIGNSCARPLSETDWSQIGTPRIYSREEQRQWASNVAYCQWTLAEWESGVAWAMVKQEIAKQAKH